MFICCKTVLFEHPEKVTLTQLMVWFGGRAICFVDQWKMRGAFVNICLKNNHYFRSSVWWQSLHQTIRISETSQQHNTGFMSVQQLMKSQSLFKSTIVCMYNAEILHIPTRFSYNWEKQTQHDISSPWCKESWYQHANKLWQYTTLNDIIGHYIRHCVCEIGHFKNIVYSLNVTLKCC